MKIKTIKLNLVIFVGLVILSFALFAVAQQNSTSDKNIFLDTDQDGLSDEEEKMYGTDPTKADTDGDGYTDGAEVKSGYDPLKPAPGDKIVKQETKAVQDTKNLPTSQASKTQDTSKTTEVMNNNQDAATANITDISIENENLTQKFSAKIAFRI